MTTPRRAKAEHPTAEPPARTGPGRAGQNRTGQDKNYSMTFTLYVLLLWSQLLWWRLTRPVIRSFVPRKRPHSTWTAPAFCSRRKPDWVIRELIHLKAWTPKLGCRRIADAFNRRHAADGVCVSKSHVARVLIQHGAAVAKLRRKLSRRRPADGTPCNTEWAMDLTTVTDASRRQHLLLGVLDAGTRACVALHKVMGKRSITVWRTLITLLHQCGIPNEFAWTTRPASTVAG